MGHNVNADTQCKQLLPILSLRSCVALVATLAGLFLWPAGSLVIADDAADSLIAHTVSSIVTARAALDRGSMTYRHEVSGGATVEKGEAKTRTITHGTLVWVGKDSFEESQTYGRILTETKLDYEDADTSDETTTHPEYEYIHTPGFRCVHRLGKDCLFTKKNAFPPGDPGKPHRLFPPVAWFTFLQDSRFYHEKQLDFTMPTEISRDEKNPHLAIIDRNSTNGLMHSQYIIDSSRAGLLIQFRSRSTMKGQDWHEHRYDWAQDPHGVWYVKEHFMLRTKQGAPESVVSTNLTTVTAFNSRPEIPRNRFDRSSLQLAKGTRIVDNTGQGSRVSFHGGPPPKQLNLDDLIPAAKDGFAAPARDEQ